MFANGGEAMALEIEEGDRNAFLQPGSTAVGLDAEINGMRCIERVKEDGLVRSEVIVGVVHTDPTDPFPGGDHVVWITEPGDSALCG